MTDPIPEPLTLREAAQRVIEVVDEPSPQDDGTPEVEVGWYLRWEARHREAVDALRAALARQATPAPGGLDGHENDGEGACVICREYEPNTDGVYNRTPFPCPKVRLAVTTASGGLDVDVLRTVLYDWMPNGADVSDPDRDGEGLHLTGGDLARFIFDRAREYARLTSEATS